MQIRDGIIFMSGAAVGGLTAALLLKNKYKNKYEKIANDKCSSMQEYVNKLRELDKEGNLTSNLEYMGDAIPEVKEVADEAKEITKDALEEAKNYASMYAPSGAIVGGVAATEAFINSLAENEHPTDEDDEEETQEEGIVVDADDLEDYDSRRMKRQNGQKRYDPPKIIRADEFDDYAWHDKQTLYFYQEDGVLASDTDNEIVLDPEALVGDALEKYGFATNDEREIYVRNFRIGTDYDIIKVFGAYDE